MQPLQIQHTVEGIKCQSRVTPKQNPEMMPKACKDGNTSQMQSKGDNLDAT
jgi:hypothetical protein